MKIKQTDIDKMTKAIKNALDYLGDDVPVQKLKDKNACVMDTIWWFAYMQTNFNDSNLNVKRDKDGFRILPRDETLKLYPEGCHDCHIQTALKHIFKNLGY